MEFGTNTGRQGTFDPNDPKQKEMALKQLQALASQYGEMLDPNYTGPTGFSPTGLGEYSQWKNATTEAQNIQRILSGNQPLSIRLGGSFPSQVSPSIANNPRSTFNTSQGPFGQFGAKSAAPYQAYAPYDQLDPLHMRATTALKKYYG